MKNGKSQGTEVDWVCLLKNVMEIVLEILAEIYKKYLINWQNLPNELTIAYLCLFIIQNS